MSDNQMIVYGNLGTEVDYRESKGFGWAMFRLGSTPRIFDRNLGRWRDLETVWITVKASRSLGQNVASSLKVGDPVVVIGRLRSHTWEDKETREQHQRQVLEATVVGHDLNRGTATFTRNEPAAVQEQSTSDGEAVAEFESSHAAPPPGARAEPVPA